jgi:DNA-binding NarL/FixJ family response regulator
MTAPQSSNSAGACLAVVAEDDRLSEVINESLAPGPHSVLVSLHSAGDLDEALADGRIDCVVFGVFQPKQKVIDSARSFAAKAPDSAALVLMCEELTSDDARRAVTGGVAGIVMLSDAREVLGDVITVVSRGQVCVPRQRREAVNPPALTSRERQVLSLVLMDQTNAQIARKLFLAESTVKSHLGSAFTKLGVSSRSEAVRLILDPELGRGLGILTIPSERIPAREAPGAA